MILDHHYVRRCIQCWYDQRLPLPPIKKRIIYLDQFVISNMMKELDPDTANPDGFYYKLFATLDRLSKLQLIVCPASPLHDHESLVDTRYPKIRAVFRQLSHGVTFVRPSIILHAQIIRAFHAWRDQSICDQSANRESVLTKNPDVWQARYRIELNCTVDGLVEELNAKRNLITGRLHKICLEWRNDQHFEFNQVFERELASSARILLEQYARHLARYAAVSQGQIPLDDEVCFPPAAVMLVTRMTSELADAFPQFEDRFAAIREFFLSKYFRAVPGARTSALFWAAIARDVNAGRNPDRFPKAGMFTDIDAVASYSPFCDTMFVDKEISHLTKQKELERELAHGARFYSLRRNEKADFLSYLETIENEMPSEHLGLVHAVYGCDWPSPFTGLLGISAH